MSRQSLLWCFWAAELFQGQAVLGSCSMECSTSRGWEQLAWPLGDKEGLSQGSWNWQDHPMMEADFPWLGRSCSGVSRLWSPFSRLAVLGTSPQQCNPSKGQASQGRESP